MKKLIYLLDTNIITEMAKSKPDPNMMKKLAPAFSSCAISSIVWNSLLFGLQNMPEGKLKDYYSEFLLDYIQTELPILPYDSHAALIHADLRTKLSEAASLINFEDTQNAAIAISNQMIFVTKNSKTFETIKKLNPVFFLENWFEE